MSTQPTQINMGYGGFCAIDWRKDSLVKQTHSVVSTEPSLENAQQVFITGGNIGVTFNRPTENSYKAPRGTTSAAPLLFSPGTASISGSISFDMSHLNLDYFLNQERLSRNTYFHLIMSTGAQYYAVYYNMWNSFTISAASGGLVTCSVGYMSLNCFQSDIFTASSLSATLQNVFDNALVAYWQAGTQGYIESFTINLTQDVTPVYLNNDLIMPSYLRSGSLKLNANIQSCVSWQNISKVLDLATYNYQDDSSTDGQDIPGQFSFNIGNKMFQLNNSLLTSKEYSHSGAGDVAKFSYGIQSVALKSPSESLFTISDSSF